MATKKKKAEEKISAKNYVYAILILVVAILLTLYIFAWIKVNKEEKLVESYLLKTSTINYKIEDIHTTKQVLSESPTSYFIFIGYSKDEEEYNIEKSFKKVIDNYKLNDMFYYIDVTPYIENDEYKDILKKELNVNIDNAPALIYVHEGEILESNILDGIDDTKLKVNDFNRLLEIYEFKAV